MKLAGLWVVVVLGCGASPPSSEVSEKAAIYEFELTACSQKAATLRESIACENEVRARYGRPLRAMPKDGGS